MKSIFDAYLFVRIIFIYKQIILTKMETRTIYDKPQCEVLELVEQSVLCSSAVDGMSFGDPWSGLGGEEEW